MLGWGECKEVRGCRFEYVGLSGGASERFGGGRDRNGHWILICGGE
jgi:hypothetical protein